MTPAVNEKVFDQVFLSTDTANGFVEEVVSHAVRVAGNSLKIDAIVVIIDSGGTLTLQLEGSYDGQVWSTASTISTSISGTTGPNQRASGLLSHTDYPFVRLRATISGSGTKQVLFSGWLAFSEQ